MRSNKKKRKTIKFASVMCVIVVITAAIIAVKASNESYYNNAKKCDPGYYLNSGKCVVCPGGSYCNNNKKYSCPKGKGSLAGSKWEFECGACAKGYYSKGDGKGCVACPTGTYQDKAGQTSCIKCATGTYQSKTGQTSCKKCAAGSYQNKTGQTSCINCATGTYQNKAGQTSCIKCTAGTYQDKTGQKTCIKCAAGTYQTRTGQASCVKCSLGTYQDKTGQTSCKKCPQGTASTMPGSTKCFEKRNCKESTDPKDSEYNSCIKNAPALKLSKTVKKIKVGQSVTIHVNLPNCGTFIQYTRISSGGEGGANRWFNYVDQETKNETSSGYDWVITGKKVGSTCISQTVQYDAYSPSGKCAANIKPMVNVCIDITSK